MTPLPISIALVDDYSPLRSLLCNYLSKQGFTISCAVENGLELLEKLDKCTELPDVCLLDILMPKMDGYQTAQILKDRFPTIKIMAYSNSVIAESASKKMIECGADACIIKNISPNELAVALRGLVTPELTAPL